MRFRKGVRTKLSGFSLVELLVVVAIILVVSAVAVPNIMRAMSAYRLRSAAGEQAQLLQRLRMEAVNSNRDMRISWWWNWDGDSWNMSFYVDRDLDWQMDAGEPFVTMPQNMWWGWGPSMATMNLDYAPVNTWQPPGFNSRGIPCAYGVVTWNECSTTTPGGAPIGFAYFLTDIQTGNWGAPTGYAAITVSPSGKVSTWTWDGNSWQ